MESSERKEKKVGPKRIILSIQSITGGGTISEMRGYHERFRGIPCCVIYIQAVITEAIKQNASHEQLILTLLTNELQQRMINREKARLRSANFPQLKYLQDLDRAELPEDGRARLPELETLEFIKEGQNIILGGSPGTGYVKLKIM